MSVVNATPIMINCQLCPFKTICYTYSYLLLDEVIYGRQSVNEHNLCLIQNQLCLSKVIWDFVEE